MTVTCVLRSVLWFYTGPDDSKHLIKDSNLMLTVADAMLARDKLLAAVR